jgi:protein involved in ribonucleotide reduction
MDEKENKRGRLLEIENIGESYQEFISRVNIEIIALVEQEELESDFVQIPTTYVEGNKEEATERFVVDKEDRANR